MKIVKGSLSDQRQFVTTESRIKMMKKGLKRLDKKVKVKSKIYDATDWSANNLNIHIDEYFKK